MGFQALRQLPINPQAELGQKPAAADKDSPHERVYNGVGHQEHQQAEGEDQDNHEATKPDEGKHTGVNLSTAICLSLRGNLP